MIQQRPHLSLQLQEELDDGTLKGGTFAAHADWLKLHAGTAAVAALRARLSARTGIDVPGIFIANTTFPFRLLIAMDREIVAEHGHLVPDVLRELGAHSASRNHSGRSPAMDGLSAHDFFARSAKRHAGFQDFIPWVTYEREGECAGTYTHHEPRCFSPVYCASTVGYLERCALLHRARTARVDEVRCRCRGDRDCTFRISWTTAS